MKRLFIALDLPASIRKELTALQPDTSPHIRLVNPDQMHVTVYFIGDADPEPIQAMLETVTCREFSITLQGLGQFRTGNRKTVLWAGVKNSLPLNKLHDTIASALHNQGVLKEIKSYVPHVTLARCSSRTPTIIIENFLKQDTSEHMREIKIDKFGLFSSTVVNNQLVYTQEKSYCLSGTPS